MTFTESLHPRGAKGTSSGGEFVKGSGQATSKAPSKSPVKVTKEMPRPTGRLTKTLSYDPKTNRGAGYGVKGGDPHVRSLQEALNRLGVTDSHGRRLAVDGDLGPLTTSAIRSAQTRLGLPADGKVTPAFLDRLLNTRSLPGHRASSMHHAPTGHGPTHHTTTHHAAPKKPLKPTTTAPLRIFARSDMGMGGGDIGTPVMQPVTDGDLERMLRELLGGLTDEEVAELASLAEAMHAEGGN